jgi:hypothetical protein
VVERWHQLPPAPALSRVPAVRPLVQSLADRVARARGRSGPAAEPVPDLGPAAVMDQLSVMVFDLFRADPDADPGAVADALAGIRRSL